MNKTNKQHIIIKLIVVVTVIILILCMVLVIRLRNSYVIKPVATMIPKDVIYYEQKDESWKDDKLGASSYTMEHSGCLTTCIASVMQMQHLDSKNPGEMNRLFSEKDVYDDQGNIQWNELEQSLGVAVVREQVTNGSEIQALLQQGIFPIVRLRVMGLGNFHYVVLVGSDEDTFLCMDPLNEKNELIPLSKHGNRIYAIRYLQ